MNDKIQNFDPNIVDGIRTAFETGYPLADVHMKNSSQQSTSGNMVLMLSMKCTSNS